MSLFIVQILQFNYFFLYTRYFIDKEGLSFSNINPLDSFLTGGYKRKATDIKTI